MIDTHVLIWSLTEPARISPEARRAIESMEAREETIFVSAISFVETLYLEEKGRIPAGTLEGIVGIAGDPERNMEVVPVRLPDILTMARIPRDQVPDMPDRIIAATALHLGVPVISADRQIRVSGLTTIW